MIKDYVQLYFPGCEWVRQLDEDDMHRKIMRKAARSLEKDAAHYAKEAKGAKGAKKKHEMVERKEALSAAKDLKSRARKAHEY